MDSNLRLTRSTGSADHQTELDTLLDIFLATDLSTKDEQVGSASSNTAGGER